MAERHRRGGGGDEHLRPTGGRRPARAAARHDLRRVLRHAAGAAFAARGAGARQGHLHLRAAGGGHGQLLGGEPARAGRVRARAQGRAPRRQGGGREAAQVQQRAGGARVPGRDGHHQPGAPLPPRVPRRLLHRRRPARARLRVRAQQDPRVSPTRKRAAGDGVVHEASHRAGVGERARLPARRLPSSDHPPRHQVRQHSSRQQLRSDGRGLRAGQADLGQQHARVDPRHGHVRVPGAGVRVEREADGEVGRVLLRRDAARAPHGAAPRRRRRHRQLVPRGQPRRLGEAGPVARAGRRRLRRRRGPEAAGQLRSRGDAAAGRQRRGRRAPLGQKAPQDEPDREGVGGGHVAGGPERGGAARAEHGVRHGGCLVQGQQGSRAVHVRHGADQTGSHGDPGVQRPGRHGIRRPCLADRKRGILLRRRVESGEGSAAQVAAAVNCCAVHACDDGPLQFMLAAPLLVARSSCSGVCEQPAFVTRRPAKAMYIWTLITRRMCR